jgi:protein-S-isoprenylcysteine O-methyltransferase Ste14
LAARTSSSSAGRAAVVVGALSVLAIPAGIAAAQLLKGVRLLEASTIAVPAGFVLGVVAVSAARRARFKVDRSVWRSGERTARVGRFLAWTGLYLAVTGALALGFYGILRWAQ